MKWILPLLFVSLGFSFTVKVITNTDGVIAYYGSEGQVVLKKGENLIEFNRPVLMKFSAFYGEGWVSPRKVLVDSTGTVYVIASLKTVNVSIDTSPSAKFYITSEQGKFYIGDTPFKGKIPPGKWNFLFEADGYYPLKRILNIEEGKSYYFKLEPKSLYTFVTTPAASAFVDDAFLGETPVSTILKSGTHTVSFFVKGIPAKRLEIHVDKDSKPTILRVELPRLVHITVTTDPYPAFVTVDGEVFRSPVVLRTLEGEHHVECWLDGYEKVKRDLNISSDLNISCDMDRIFHRLVFTDEGTLTLDGELVGYGREFRVADGFHVLEFEWSNGKKGFWVKEVKFNEFIAPSKDIGTVIVLSKKFIVDGEEYAGPVALNLRVGKHMLYSNGALISFDVAEGDVKVLPGGGALFVLSEPQGLKMIVRTSSGLKEVVSPEIIGAVGKVSIVPIEGCKIGKMYNVNLKDGEYKVILIDSRCLGGSSK